MDAAARTRALQARAFEQRERQRVWWEAFRESRSMGIPQADARDRADTMVAFYDRERAANGGRARLHIHSPRAEEHTVKRVAKNMAELVAYFDSKASNEQAWAERARYSPDKRRAEIRAEVFREVAADLGETEIAQPEEMAS